MKRIRSLHIKVFLCCTILYALICFTGILDKQKIWSTVDIDYRDNKQSYSLQNGDSYGVVTGGPYTELPPGTYRLRWQIEGDGINKIHLECSNDVPILPAVFETTPGTFEGEGYFEIPETLHNFRICVEFSSGSYINVYNMRLYSPVYTDNYFSLAAIMTLLLILWWMQDTGRLPLSRREILVPLFIAVVAVSIPALRDHTVFSLDTQFHAARLHNLADSLKSGQFPARIGGYSYNGYGAATSIFYPDFLLYPLACLLNLGASITYVFNVLFIAIHTASALCMYIAAKRILRNNQAAVAATLLYVFNGFRIQHLYGNCMIGQILAMAFLPVFLLGLWEVFFGEKKRWPVLTAGATLVFQSHILSTVMCAAVAFALALLYIRKLFLERRIVPLLQAAGFTLFINLASLVPLITTYSSGVTTSVVSFGFLKNTLEPIELLGAGKALDIILILGVSALFCCDRNEISKETMTSATLLGAIGIVSLWLCTNLFPWNYNFVLTNNLLEILQFPWRFLSISVLCLSLCGGLGYACLLKKKSMPGIFAILAFLVISTVPVVENALNISALEFGLDVSSYMLTPEYQFEGTNLDITKSRSILTDGKIQYDQYTKSGTQIDVYVDAAEGSSITFPLFGFDGYIAELNGQEINWYRGDNNCLTVMFPADASGLLSIRFKGLAIWKAADLLSLTSLFVLIVHCVKKKRLRTAHAAG